jgi:hypothetical protein
MSVPIKLRDRLAKEAPPPANPCKVFLKEFLDGGPILRAFVYRESQNKNLEWEDVKEAFHALNGREYVQKGEWFWRIYPE